MSNLNQNELKHNWIEVPKEAKKILDKVTDKAKELDKK